MPVHVVCSSKDAIEKRVFILVPNFILRMIGYKIADKLQLQEGGLMPTKPWWQSKTILSGIVTGVVGVYLSLIANGVHLPAIPAWIITILSAVGIYGRVTADTTITS